MTNEEARQILMSIEIESYRDVSRQWFFSDVNEVLDLAIKALEQQPSEDCISRAEALKAIEKEKQGWEGAERYAIDECHTRISELPSVTLTRPNGKWERISPAGIYECTNCKQLIMTSDIDCYKYCHGCGVRMEGEE